MKKNIAILFLTVAVTVSNALARQAFGADSGRADSIQSLSMRINAEPKNPQLYITRATLYSRSLQFDKSVLDLTRSLSLQPSAAAYASRAIAYRELGNYDKSLADLNKATQLDPNSQDAFATLGALEKQLHHCEKSCKAFSQLLKLNPDRSVERARRAEVYLEMHKPAQALEDMKIALKTDPDPSGKGHATMGMAYFQLEQYEKAVEALSVSLKKNPTRASVRKARAEAYDKLGKPALAKQDRLHVESDYSELFENAPFRTKL